MSTRFADRAVTPIPFLMIRSTTVLMIGLSLINAANNNWICSIKGLFFPDETQRIYVLKSNKVEELRDAVEQMKKVYSQCDWSAFDYKLR